MAFYALHNESTHQQPRQERILNIPNIITFARLLLIPIAFILIVGEGSNIVAFFLFALAGLTDFIDGYIARKTNTVTEFGKAIDPLVDRLLLACGVIALFAVGKLPLWILAFLIIRDAFLLSSVAIINRITTVEVKIRMVGKIATTALLIGFAGLILGIGTVPQGLGWTTAQALPAFTAEPYLFWIWFVYLGLIFSLITAIAYTWDGIQLLKKTKAEQGPVAP